jgi:hypothetical protein
VQKSGLVVLPETLSAPRAEVLYRLGHQRAERGEVTDRRFLLPLYVRPPEAEERWAQRHARRSDS